MQEATTVRSKRNLIAGAIFVAIAALFATEALNYPLGSPLRMGPGFIPLTLAGLLALLGVVTFSVGLSDREMVEVTPVPWVAMGLILASLAIFGFFARQLGFVPVVFVCATLTAFASRNNSILASLIIAACMSAACYLIFKVGLGITLPTFGTFFSF
jgi:hypothetical protein